MNRSFIVVCNELDISDIECIQFLRIMIHGITVEQWADYTKEEFLKHQRLLTDNEKDVLVFYLKICEGILRK